MKRVVLFFLFTFSSFVWSTDKDAVVSTCISILQRLQKFARDSHDDYPELKLRAKIDALLPTTLSSEQLYRLGVSTCLIAFPQEAGSDIPFDNVFAYASHRCAKLLSDRTDLHLGFYLRDMKLICGSDGGESLIYRELIAHQEQLRKKAKTE